MKKLFTLFVTLCFWANTFGQAGQPDPLFGNNGVVKADLGSASINVAARGNQVITKPDGTIYVIGSIYSGNSTFVAKRLPDGNADLSYGINGCTSYTYMRNPHATLQQDGKIVITGTTSSSPDDIVLARYNVNGTIDSSFANNGTLYIDYNSNSHDQSAAIAVQDDGKILIGISTEDANYATTYAVLRFKDDGSFDSTFSGDGRQKIGVVVSALAVQADGKIIAAGANNSYLGQFSLTRLNTDGSTDSTFGTNGTVITDFNLSYLGIINALVVQNDNKIIAAGYVYRCGIQPCHQIQFALARYNPNGDLDSTFHGNGKQQTPFSGSAIANSVALQADGKIVLAGTNTTVDSSFFALVRYNINGKLDATFNGDGKLLSDFTHQQDNANSVAIQNDGKIVVAGSVNNYLSFDIARYNVDGTFDNTFGSNGNIIDNYKSSSHFTQFDHAGMQPDGKVVAGGSTTDSNSRHQVTARFNRDGTIDSVFNGFRPIPGQSLTSIKQPDGKIVSLGGFGFTRYNPDGTIDVFSEDPVIGDGAIGNAIAVQRDGKVVVAGQAYLTTTTGSTTLYSMALALARFNIDGTLDISFGNGGTIVGYFDLAAESIETATAVGVQSDGTIVVSINELYPIKFADPEGPMELAEVDLARYDFNGNSMIGLGVFPESQNGGPIFIQDDDKILYGIDGKLVRYNANGGLDNTFQPVPISSSTLRQDDGKIITGSPSISRYSPDGIPDSSFGTNGSIPSIDYIINEIRITNNRLVAAGYTQNGQNSTGVVGVYLLDDSSSLSCPSPQTVSNDKEKCSAVVASIDPVLTDSTLMVNYTLTGTTTLNGTGSASGLTFNGGITTVTYALANDPSATCSFDVTVNDSEAPRMTSVVVVPEVLWPVTQKMQRVFLDYQTKDNCSTPSCQISVTGNQDVSGDWAMVDDHVVNIRATQDQGRERIYTVTVTCTDAAGNSSSKNTKVRVPGQHLYPNIDGGGSPSFEYAGALSVNAYPNPGNDYFKLHIVSPDKTNQVAIKVYDITGRLMEEKHAISAGQDTRVGEALGAGVYLVQIQQGKNWVYTKLVKTAGK